MESRAVSKYVGTSVKKTQIPADIVRGMRATEAMDILKYMPKSAAHGVRKALGSAIANAVHNKKLDAGTLYVKEIRIDRGPAQRRIIYKGKGGFAFFKRPTSHITVLLADRTDAVTKKSGARSQKSEAKVEKKEEVKVVAKAGKEVKTKKTAAKTAKKSSEKKDKE